MVSLMSWLIGGLVGINGARTDDVFYLSGAYQGLVYVHLNLRYWCLNANDLRIAGVNVM